MKYLPLLLTVLLALTAVSVRAQLVLDNFNSDVAAGQGSTISGSTWVGQVSQGASTITVGGTARNDNGWGVSNLTPFDASAMASIVVVAQLEPGNAAGFFNIQFVDNSFGSQSFSIASSAFLTGTMSTVSINIGSWSGINPTQITGWSMGGGGFTTTGPAFAMSFDDLSLSTSAVPEPSTYALGFGAIALGLAIWRRRLVLEITPSNKMDSAA